MLAPGSNTWSNIPRPIDGYVARPQLETQATKALTDQAGTVVTLVGKGGIGKTSLALSVLHSLQRDGPFEAILWFSSRDIDLLPDGPRPVTPDVLDQPDVARDLVRLFAPAEREGPSFSPVDYLAGALQQSPIGGPILFVFDNFETVRNPVDLFQWLYTFIRLPNRALITTRFRDFNGDYAIAVPGMELSEARSLIMQTADDLGIAGMITEEYVRELYRESEGHPYVLKILLGETAKAGEPQRVSRIFAGSDELMAALFERTYRNLSILAKRTFLALCNWRSAVPEIALEAVLIRSSESRIDVRQAVEELEQSSFIESSISEKDGSRFLSVPLVARMFGDRKLAVDPLKPVIDQDKQMLIAFGAVQDTDLRHGFQPRGDRLLTHIAREAEKRPEALDDYREMLEFIGRRYPPAWERIASLFEESSRPKDRDDAKEFLRRYLQSELSDDDRRTAWKRLAQMCRRTSDVDGELHALVEMCGVPNTWYYVLSDSAHRLNSLLSEVRGKDNVAAPVLGRRLAEAMEERLSEADASDCSRIAWIWLHLNDEDRARKVVDHGLTLEPMNPFLRKLVRGFSSRG